MTTVQPLNESAAADRALLALQLDIALSVVPLISDMAEEADERAVVVADIAECWRRLPAAVRQEYGSWPGHPDVTRFAGDYVEEVDRLWLEAPGLEPDTVHDSEAERLCRMAWLTHLEGIRRRASSEAPPPAEWLARFTSPDARASC